MKYDSNYMLQLKSLPHFNYIENFVNVVLLCSEEKTAPQELTYISWYRIKCYSSFDFRIKEA